MTPELESLQEQLAYSFSEQKLLRTALTHSSHANEISTDHNERLEFLGDAVLQLSISEELFLRFPGASEGELTRMRSKLVSSPSLTKLAQELELKRHILLGKGEETQGGRERPSLLSDAMEAVFGAVFLDGGFEAAKRVILRLFAKRMPGEPEAPKIKDYKSRLQELTQRDYKQRPTYQLSGCEGPEHAKIFVVELGLPCGRSLRASGTSLKRAEQEAARLALELLAQSPQTDGPGDPE